MGKRIKAQVEIDDNFRFTAMVDPTWRWNGFVSPHFTLDEAKKVAEITQECAKRDGFSSWDTVHVIEGDAPEYVDDDEDGNPIYKNNAVVLVISWQWLEDKPSKIVEVIDPDEDGLYPIGGGSWTWCLVEE